MIRLGLGEGWLQERGVDCPDGSSYIAKTDSYGNIIAAVGFHSWNGRDIEMNIPPARLPRALLRACYAYVVNQLGCDRVTLRCRADNAAALRDAARMGAKFEGSSRRFYEDGCAQFTFGLLKEDFPHGLRPLTPART